MLANEVRTPQGYFKGRKYTSTLLLEVYGKATYRLGTDLEFEIEALGSLYGFGIRKNADKG